MSIVIKCDRCNKFVDSPPPGVGATVGYYSAWFGMTNPGEEHVCDACMWSDPRYIAAYGVTPPRTDPYTDPRNHTSEQATEEMLRVRAEEKTK